MVILSHLHAHKSPGMPDERLDARSLVKFTRPLGIATTRSAHDCSKIPNDQNARNHSTSVECWTFESWSGGLWHAGCVSPPPETTQRTREVRNAGLEP
jgi:hypothetical protein